MKLPVCVGKETQKEKRYHLVLIKQTAQETGSPARAKQVILLYQITT